jgi:hypothetical protein
MTSMVITTALHKMVEKPGSGKTMTLQTPVPATQGTGSIDIVSSVNL